MSKEVIYLMSTYKTGQNIISTFELFNPISQLILLL